MLSQKNIQELIFLNREIVNYLNDNYDALDSIIIERFSSNLKEYIEYLQLLEHREAIAELISAIERSESGITNLVTMNTDILDTLSDQFYSYAS